VEEALEVGFRIDVAAHIIIKQRQRVKLASIRALLDRLIDSVFNTLKFHF
jgi:hypothetical protein